MPILEAFARRSFQGGSRCRAGGTERAARPLRALVLLFLAVSWGWAQPRRALGKCLRKTEAESPDPRSSDPGCGSDRTIWKTTFPSW